MAKKNLRFGTLEALQPVINILNDAALALNDKTRTLQQSPLSEVITGVMGAGVGGVASFGALYALGTVGLSAAGITSGLAAAGALVGGGMVAGIFVLAAPIAILAGTGVALAAKKKAAMLKKEKERLLQEALKKHQALIGALKSESDADKERLEYLKGLLMTLKVIIRDLGLDLGVNLEAIVNDTSAFVAL